MHIWTNIISFAVVPVVIISACGLLCLAFYNRLASIVSRLRSLQRERLSEYREVFRFEEGKKDKAIRQEAEHFLHFLEEQTCDVLKRARYLRNCIFCLICAIFSLVLTSLLIGLSLIYPAFDSVVLGFFIFGLLLILFGLFYAILELKIALNPIKMESAFVQRLLKAELVDKS